MELRTSRSRSKTPITTLSLEKEIIEGENHIEQVVRTTRSTTKTFERYTSLADETSELSNKPLKYKTGKTVKSVQKAKFRTSDYSSEEGEGDLSSSPTITTQNFKNQLIEETHSSANGNSEISALELYRKAGRYWDVYPKTDWTYSRHSKDRVELAPGIIAMPNMSRKSLHDFRGPTEQFISHKQTNTDSYDTVDESYTLNYRPRKFFTNNNYEDNYVSSTRLYKKQTTFRYKIRSIFVSIYTTVLSVFYFLYKVQNFGLIWIGKKLHNFSSRVMLFDTWLLKSSPKNKLPYIITLCLLPLLLFGGWWLLSSLSQTVYGIYFNSTESTLPLVTPTIKDDLLYKNYETNEKYFQPSSATTLTTEQLNEITATIKNSLNIEKQLDANVIVQKILNSPDIKNIINNYKIQENDEVSKDQQQILNNLKEEINKIKIELHERDKTLNIEINKIITQLRSENLHNNARLTYELKKCCRNSFINIESHVFKVLKELLIHPLDQNEISSYLHALFVAKEDLETRLANLTSHLHEDFNVLITNNAKHIMEDVTTQLSKEIKKYITSNNEINVDLIADTHIEKIVKNALSLYDADKTGLVDYAMEPLGGQILSTRCTESYNAGTAVLSILGIPLWHLSSTPRAVITPGINPGECWAFQNFPGFLLIKLVSPVKIEAFTLEHISKNLVPSGKIDSAPKEFEVYGLKNETDEEPIKLGSYVYDYNGDSLQTFAAQVHGLIFDIIELRILSNHGNPNFTCLYRFRVHGSLNNELT